MSYDQQEVEFHTDYDDLIHATIEVTSYGTAGYGPSLNDPGDPGDPPEWDVIDITANGSAVLVDSWEGGFLAELVDAYVSSEVTFEAPDYSDWERGDY